jgi:hypothetical protein
MMKSRSVITFCLVTLVALVGCSTAEGPPTAGEAKDFTSACDKANDGKRIALEGFLRLPDKFTGTQGVVLRLYQADDFKSMPIGVSFKMGNQANQMEYAPLKYTDKDLKVHLSNGQIVGFGTKVKVSGKVYFPIVAQEFSCALSNPLVELAK